MIARVPAHGRPAEEPGAPPAEAHFATLLRLLPYLWPRGEWGAQARIVAALACILLGKGAIVLVPVIYKHVVDALTVPPEAAGDVVLAVPVMLVLAFGGARFSSILFNQLRDVVFARVGHRALKRIALDVFRHLHGLSLAFHLGRQTGSLSRALDRGVLGIRQFLGMVLFSVGPTIIELLLSFVVLWVVLGFQFAAIAAVMVTTFGYYTQRVTQWRLAVRRRMNQASEAGGQKQIDSLLNYETVKYFTNEDHEAARFERVMGGYEEASVRNDESLALLNIGQAFIIAIGMTVMMWLAADGVVTGRLTVGDLVLANTYLLQLAQPLNMFGWVYREIRQALVDMERMFSLLDAKIEVTDAPDARPLARAGGALSFEKVSFGYDPRRPILHEVSFEVPAGRSVAIVGPTGSGKSTIARLLFRFYDVDAGAIRIDGQDIRSLTQHSLRSAIGVVPQDTVLFNDTIFYNIAYARPGATRGQVEQAAKLAHIHEFVTGLPDGCETLVGERGLKLSGGEKQRVAIARIFLKDPPILIFDEATSALDSHTEKDIQQNLRELGAGRTTLTIAHRLSTVVDADEILVLEQGRVTERGAHGDLLARDGAYTALWARQALAEAEALEAAAE